MMGFEGDSQAFSTSGKALELLQSPLVRRNFRGQTIVLVPDVVVEGFRSVFVDQARKFVQGYRLPESRLGVGVINQRVGFLPGSCFWQVFAFNEVGECIQQSSRLAWGIVAFLTTCLLYTSPSPRDRG